MPELPKAARRSTPEAAPDMLRADGSRPARAKGSKVTELREFQDGELIAGTRYRVLRLLGVGGMGSVYEVEHVELGKRFVLKALLRELARREDLAARLRNEWRALARLQHAHIVNVTDAGTSGNGVPFYVMERLDGDTLAAHLKKHRRLPVPEALAIAVTVLEALSAAHDIGIVHRDVKPANIFLATAGGVKLLDFGIAKIADATSVVTARGLAVGTPRYMSPEQARGERVDGRSDIYATGLILFEMIVGAGPFDDARDSNELLLAHLAREAPVLSSRFPSAPAELVEILARMLAKDCRVRPAHARAVAQQLREVAERQERVRVVTSSTAPAPYDVTTAMPHALNAANVAHNANAVKASDQSERTTRAEGLAVGRGGAPAHPSAVSTRPVLAHVSTTQVTLSVNTGMALALGEAGARNTTLVTPPSFDGSSTLEMSAVTNAIAPSSLAPRGHTIPISQPALSSSSSSGWRPPPNSSSSALYDRVDSTELLGLQTPAPSVDSLPTNTRVPLPEAAPAPHVTPPPVAVTGSVAPFAPGALWSRRGALALSVLTLLLVAAVVLRQMLNRPTPARAQTGATALTAQTAAAKLVAPLVGAPSPASAVSAVPPAAGPPSDEDPAAGRASSAQRLPTFFENKPLVALGPQQRPAPDKVFPRAAAVHASVGPAKPRHREPVLPASGL